MEEQHTATHRLPWHKHNKSVSQYTIQFSTLDTALAFDAAKWQIALTAALLCKIDFGTIPNALR